MPRSTVVIPRQPAPLMKNPHHIHPPYQAYQALSPIHHQHHHTSSASLSHSTASDLHSIPDKFDTQHYSCQPTERESQDSQQIYRFFKHEQIAVQDTIPNSVKGAPTHLRPAIRKRQNSESAKRSRQRRKEAAKMFYRRFDEQCKRLSALEQKVANLLDLVQQSNDDRPTVGGEVRPKQEDVISSETTPPPAIQQGQVVTGAAFSDRIHSPSTAIEHNPVAMSSPSYEDEQQDNRSHQNIPFQEDLEALLEDCIEFDAFGSG